MPRITRTASPGVQPWLASSRIRMSGPTAARTARTRSRSPAASVPTFSLSTPKPSARRCRAAAARSTASPAASVTSVGTRSVVPPSNRTRGTPSRRAARSCRATSTAAFAASLPTTARCTSAQRATRSSGSRPISRGPSNSRTHASRAGDRRAGDLPHLGRLAEAGPAVAVDELDDQGVHCGGTAQRGDERGV